jgi:uncharacterized membrane protein YsdA (DUF1294 family)/cold shock CspA family protein
MRVKGKLIKWDNNKAFGFIAPNKTKNHVFIHKTAFSNRKRIPQINDIITFSLVKDKQGRNCASEATYSGEKYKTKDVKRKSKFTINFAIVFLGLMLVAMLIGYVPINLVFAYFGIGLVTFIIYWLDKLKAQRNAWRTPESTLHVLALIGGWPGAAIAQQTLRHKSQKKEFRSVFWFTVIINCASLAWLMSPNGTTLMSIFS